MINKELYSMEKEVFFNKDGYLIKEPEKIDVDENDFFNYLSNGSICFIGDSITNGAGSNGYGWYYPLNINNQTYNIILLYFCI